jgi:uncharacterized membrane protein YdjX (TVP38/TMEM64 family)
MRHPFCLRSNSVIHKTILITVVSFVALTLALTLMIESVGPEALRAGVAEAGPLAPLLYIAVRALTFIVAPLSSGPLGFSAGILFGLIPGVALTLLAEVIGGSVNFWLARRLGRPVVERFVGRRGFGRVERLYQALSSPWMLVYARLFLFAAYDFVSYAAGLTTLKFRHFLLVTALFGVIPVTISVGIGASLTGSLEQLFLLYVFLGSVSVVMYLLVGRVRRIARRLLSAEDKRLPA